MKWVFYGVSEYIQMPHKQQGTDECYVYLNVFAVNHNALYLESNEAVEKPEKK